MTTLPLWTKLLIGTASITSLLLLGFLSLKDIQFSLPNQKPPEEKNSPVITPFTSNPVSELVEIKIIVINTRDKQPIENAKVRLIVSNGSSETGQTDEGGYTIFTIKKGTKPRVLITKSGFKNIDKILNENINPNEVKFYYLEPQENQTSVKSFHKNSSIVEKPFSFPKPLLTIEKPFSSPKPLLTVEKPLSSPKPSLTVEKPKSLTKDTIYQKQAFNKAITNPELALLETYTIEIFF